MHAIESVTALAVFFFFLLVTWDTLRQPYDTPTCDWYVTIFVAFFFLVLFLFLCLSFCAGIRQVLMIATSGINVANCYKQYGSTVDVLRVRNPSYPPPPPPPPFKLAPLAFERFRMLVLHADGDYRTICQSACGSVVVVSAAVHWSHYGSALPSIGQLVLAAPYLVAKCRANFCFWCA